MRQIVLDTETTGLNPNQGHRIIEIGCIELINRKLSGNNYHVYINPQRQVEEGAVNIHGITNDFLTDKPVFSAIADGFYQFIKGAELIIHNAPFDIGFINHEFQLLESENDDVNRYCVVTDTLAMARAKHPGQRNNLDALCKRYHIDNSSRTLHGALLDAEILAEVYLAMTGGQRMLFMGSNESKGTGKRGEMYQLPSDRVALKIIKASPEEYEKHRQMIGKLNAQAGQCYWTDD